MSYLPKEAEGWLVDIKEYNRVYAITPGDGREAQEELAK